MWHALAEHWPEYLIEAMLLGLFMIAACVGTAILEHPGSPVRRRIPDTTLRRAIMGVAMGLTAVALIYSPMGARSGAHMNPAFTLAMLTLGKVAPWDAMFYIIAQFSGGILGVGLCSIVMPRVLSDPAVGHATTIPGRGGRRAAFIGEAAISAIMMAMVLGTLSLGGAARYTGLLAGVLVALFISFEAPLSGMSLNPARTLGSAVFARRYDALWVYFLAPVLSMQLTAAAYAALEDAARVHCAKLNHPPTGPCHFGCDRP